MPALLTAALLSLAVVFVAELGDKSQLITMTYALRHRWWVVLTGVAIAACLVHGLSVTIGHFLGMTLPERPIAFAAAIAFLLFAIWTWREGRTGDDAEEDVRVAEPRFVLFAIVSSFVLAELGDKTMLATVALASDNDAVGVWIGATVGMVLADGVAIAVGVMLHKRLPDGLLHAGASLLFLLFGLWMLFDAALGWRPVAVAATGAVIATTAIVVLVRVLRRRRGSGDVDDGDGDDGDDDGDDQAPPRESSAESAQIRFGYRGRYRGVAAGERRPRAGQPPGRIGPGR